MSGYRLNTEALADIDEIREFIAQESLDAADRVRDAVHKTIRSIAAFPAQGHLRPDLTGCGLRFAVGRKLLSADAFAELEDEAHDAAFDVVAGGAVGFAALTVGIAHVPDQKFARRHAR